MAADKTITIAHSPDSDDAFMFYALASGKIGTPGYRFVHEMGDIESLNLRAEEGIFDVSAVSFHAWPYVRRHYRLMTVGASVGEGYGPTLVSKRHINLSELDEITVGVAGTLTTSYLALKILSPGVRTRVIPFDRILEAVLQGRVDAGLLIHEGQLTWKDHRLNRIIDLGEWWTLQTGLPLPLGGNAVHRRLGNADVAACVEALQATVRYALEHRGEALDYAIQFARGLDRARAEKFVGMYVNERTLDLGDRGEEAVGLLLRLGHEIGVIEEFAAPEFVR